MDPWRTGIVKSADGQIQIRGYDVTALMTQRTFADTIFVLHKGQLPSPEERALLDAILTGVADHGSGAPSCAAARLVASGNRQSLSAAIAAGVLAIGEEHGGAATGCMEMIADGVARAKDESIAIEESARRTVLEARAKGQRLPGIGHRVHSHDPRTPVLFGMARTSGLAGNGVVFMDALEGAVRDVIKPLTINIDGALAAVLHDLGFPPIFGNLAFIIGRVAGLAAEVAEEYERERAMRIRIPVQYDGPGPRPID